MVQFFGRPLVFNDIILAFYKTLLIWIFWNKRTSFFNDIEGTLLRDTFRILSNIENGTFCEKKPITISAKCSIPINTPRVFPVETWNTCDVFAEIFVIWQGSEYECAYVDAKILQYIRHHIKISATQILHHTFHFSRYRDLRYAKYLFIPKRKRTFRKIH